MRDRPQDRHEWPRVRVRPARFVGRMVEPAGVEAYLLDDRRDAECPGKAVAEAGDEMRVRALACEARDERADAVAVPAFGSRHVGHGVEEVEEGKRALT